MVYEKDGMYEKVSGRRRLPFWYEVDVYRMFSLFFSYNLIGVGDYSAHGGPLCAFSGGAGPVDRERRPDSGQQRPDLPPAEDSIWTDPLLSHPADLPLHLREQKDGHHCPGENLVVCVSPSVDKERRLLCRSACVTHP